MDVGLPSLFPAIRAQQVDPDLVEKAQHDPFKIVSKPKFANGEIKKCPSCGKESLYRAFELMYYGDALGAAG